MSMDLLNLLDANVTDLADLQKFEPNPAGSYRMGISWELPDHEDTVIVVMTLTTLECLDVPGVEEDKMPEPGKKATFYMRLQHKDGSPLLWPDKTPNTQDQGRFKEVLLALVPVFNPDGTLSNRQMMEASEGAEVLVTLKVKASKADSDVKFNVIKTLILAE